jgi:hypothetical protein
MKTHSKSRLPPQYGCPALLLAAALALAMSPPAIAAHDHSNNHGVTAFVSAEGVAHFDNGDTDHDGDAVADLLFSYRPGRWRVLGEFVLSPDEHEFERLQAGFEFTDNSTLWFGRFHQPASVWNSVYHHGQFLQTSITRPAIEDWEDDAGPLPQHITGLLFESLIPREASGAWRISAGMGVAPRLSSSLLHPYSPFGSSDGHSGHGSLKLEWLPDAFGETAVGVYASATKLRSNGGGGFGSALQLRSFGGFVNIGNAQFRSLTSLQLIRLSGTNVGLLGERQHLAGYSELDWIAQSALTVFARQEIMSNGRHSVYLGQFADFPARRSLAGLRWQIGKHNAVTAQFGRSVELSGNATRELRVQWSAYLP